MTRKRWILNSLYLLVALAAFSLSIFKMDNPVWIAAWIAPILLIRYMRNCRWVPAVVLGFVVLQVAVILGLLPLITMVDSASVNVDFKFVLVWQAKSGMLFLAPLVLVPFVLDKALHKHLPRWAASLVYPAGVVAVELLFSLTTGTMNTFGETQFALRPLVMTSSLFGLFGVSFVVAWFASMINYLWEEEWSIRNLGSFGVVYGAVMVAVLVYGGTAIAFPGRADGAVPVAGITTDVIFEKSMGESGLSVTEVSQLDPAGYAEVMRSPQSYVDEMREKTLDAVEAGAKIIIWQETALLLESSVADDYLLEMKNLANETDVYLLVSYERLLNEDEREDRGMRNTGVLFTPEGTIGWEYAKAFPAPGFEDVFTEAGRRDIPYLDTPYGRIGQVICADMVYPHYLRQAAVRDIDLLLVPSWDTISYTPLFTFSSGYRAVENGFTMIRITGDGHSAVIDPYYRHWAGQDSFDNGSTNFYVNVPVVSRSTLHGSVGFVFPYLVLLLLISLAVWAARRAVT